MTHSGGSGLGVGVVNRPPAAMTSCSGGGMWPWMATSRVRVFSNSLSVTSGCGERLEGFRVEADDGHRRLLEVRGRGREAGDIAFGSPRVGIVPVRLRDDRDVVIVVAAGSGMLAVPPEHPGDGGADDEDDAAAGEDQFLGNVHAGRFSARSRMLSSMTVMRARLPRICAAA